VICVPTDRLKLRTGLSAARSLVRTLKPDRETVHVSGIETGAYAVTCHCISANWHRDFILGTA